MPARKADNKKQSGKRYNPSARPPQRLAKEDRELLASLTPNTELMDYVSGLPKLTIVDGATCGL